MILSSSDISISFTVDDDDDDDDDDDIVLFGLMGGIIDDRVVDFNGDNDVLCINVL